MTAALTPEMLDQARRAIDRAMANAEIAETPELHDFSRWATWEAARLRTPTTAPDRTPRQNDRWVVTAFDFGHSDTHDCALVTAATEREAAELGAAILQQTWRDTDGLADQDIEHVFVGPWPRTAYTIEHHVAAKTAEWQCCGGPNSAGGHHGGCPTEQDSRP